MRALLFSLVAAISIAVPLKGVALDLQTAADFALPSNGVIEAQTALYANSAQLDGVAADDLFILAQKIVMNGEAHSDAWFAASEITVSGKIARHLRVAGQTASISGELGGDLTAFSSTLQVTTNATIRGRLDAMAQQASLEGVFNEDVRVMATSITLAGSYGGNVRIIGQDIVVMPGTRIAGDLIYTSGKELFLDQSIVLGGKLRRQITERAARAGWSDYVQAAGLHAAKAGAALLAGLAFLALFPFYTARATRQVQRSIFRCGAIGGLAFVATPVLAIALAISLIGLPLALIALAAYGSLLYLGKIAVALAIGSVALRANHVSGGFAQIAKMLVVGLVVIYALTFIPSFGGTIGLLIGIIGLGGLVSALVDRRTLVVKKMPPEKQPPENAAFSEDNQG